MSDKPTHVLIDRETLEILMEAAEAGTMELADGLADGTFEEDAIAGIASSKIDEAIATARSVLDA